MIFDFNECLDKEERYVKMWEYLMSIGVSFSYDSHNQIISIDENLEDFTSDTSIVQTLEDMSNPESKYFSYYY